MYTWEKHQMPLKAFLYSENPGVGNILTILQRLFNDMSISVRYIEGILAVQATNVFLSFWLMANRDLLEAVSILAIKL